MVLLYTESNCKQINDLLFHFDPLLKSIILDLFFFRFHFLFFFVSFFVLSFFVSFFLSIYLPSFLFILQNIIFISDGSEFKNPWLPKNKTFSLPCQRQNKTVSLPCQRQNKTVSLPWERQNKKLLVCRIRGKLKIEMYKCWIFQGTNARKVISVE